MQAGLRELKKARTRAAIADAAADLFGRDGYAHVAMAHVAAVAGVSEQTLYNYFPTKESLVFDEADSFVTTLMQAITARDDDTTVVDAYRRWLDRFLFSDAVTLGGNSAGGMPRLISSDDALFRALLDLAHRTADELASTLVTSDGYEPARADVLADALLAIFVRCVTRLGSASARAELEQLERDAHAALDVLTPLGRR